MVKFDFLKTPTNTKETSETRSIIQEEPVVEAESSGASSEFFLPEPAFNRRLRKKDTEEVDSFWKEFFRGSSEKDPLNQLEKKASQEFEEFLENLPKYVLMNLLLYVVVI